MIGILVSVNHKEVPVVSVNQPVVHTVPAAARLFGVGRNTLYDAVKRGEVPHIRIGRRILIPNSALEAFLSCEVAA